MSRITCNNVTVTLAESESALDGLLRAGVAVPHACRAGACQSCLVRAADGTPPPASQVGLKDSLKSQGYFLACRCVPTGDLTVSLAGDAVGRAGTRVLAVDRLTPDVARVRLQALEPFEFRPGQFVNVARPDGLARPYSIASLPGEPIELHVRKVPGGQFSGWLYDECRPGDTLELRGPIGECFYTPGKPDQPIALIGTGTGLAPLYAVARDALAQGHTGPIRLYHGGLTRSALYYEQTLRDLANQFANFSYHACVAEGVAGSGDVRVGDLEQIVRGDVPGFGGWRAFLCGNPAMVNGLRKKIFLAGAAMKDIHSDAFIMRQGA
jgi:NAD(P)H-flavin reductase/ferredoxin